MRYAAVHRSWLIADPAALDADDRALGAWVRLSVHAADLELGVGDGEIGEGGNSRLCALERSSLAPGGWHRLRRS